MTNLYDFLRDIRDRIKIGPYNMKTVAISPDELDWIDKFLASPDIDLHFKARRVDDTPTEEMVFEKHFAIKGGADEIFGLLTDAVMQNPNFGATILAVAGFYRDHCHTCDHCLEGVSDANHLETNWQFSPHKPE
jgi:hypothetical protein